MTRVGLVGVGGWGSLILRDLLALGCEVHAAVLSEQAAAAARKAGAATATAGGAAALPELDGYVVATPTTTHADVIETLLDRGRPLFVEKPICEDVRRARAIAERSGDLVFVMHKWRYHPGVERIGALVRGGELGELRAVLLRRLSWGRPHADVDPLMTLLSHDLSIVLEILGTIPPVRSAIAVDQHDPGFGLVAELGDEDREGTPRVIIHTSALEPVRGRALTVIGSEGTAALGGAYDTDVLVARDRDSTAAPDRIAVGDAMPLERELSAFVGHLAGGPPPRSSCAEAVLELDRLSELRSLAGCR